MVSESTIEDPITDQLSDNQEHQPVGRSLNIRWRILIFALLATLIPTLTMGWISYQYSRLSVEESIEQEFQSATNYISRELELWLREKLYDARVFASSYVIMENLQLLIKRESLAELNVESEHLLKMYLGSIHDKFPDYEELLVVDTSGKLFVTNLEQSKISQLPADWNTMAANQSRMFGEVTITNSTSLPTMLVGSLIQDSGQEILGTFAMSVKLNGIAQILQNHHLSQTGHIHLITRSGLLIINGTASSGANYMQERLDPRALHMLRQNQGKPLLYKSFDNTEVIGTLVEVPQTEWAILAEKSTELAFKKLQQLKKIALVIVCSILVIIGLIGSLLSLTIVRPIQRLIAGAGKVAGGDLTVDLPVQGPEEIVYLTRVFNTMVRRLRFTHTQLEYLSVTDSLTGFYNRKHLMQSLQSAVTSSEHEGKKLSIMMIDIDSFKLFNDTYGHQTGDEILIQIVSIIHSSLQEVDFPARYGGDEFLIVLPDLALEETMRLAEKIRVEIEQSSLFDNGVTGPVRVTVSIGISEYPRHGTEPESLIRAADDALYRAKAEGRNRVITATAKPDQPGSPEI